MLFRSRLDQELQPAGFEPWLITGSEAERPAAAAAPSSLSSLDATAAPAAPSDLGGTLSAQPQADLPPRANGPLAELAHGLEPGLTAASAVLADAPQRLRRKLFGSLGKARELMQACFEEAISTLHPRAEEELEPETESRFGLIPAAAASRTPTAGSLDGASGDIPSLAPRSGGSQGEPAPDPIDSAPAAAWTPSLSGSLPEIGRAHV